MSAKKEKKAATKKAATKKAATKKTDVVLIAESLAHYAANEESYRSQCESFSKVDLTDRQCNSDSTKACSTANTELFNACVYAANKSAVKSVVKRAARSQLKNQIEQCLIAAKYTRKQIIEKMLKDFPANAKSTTATYLSDSMNAKYSAFRTDKNERRLAITRKTDSVMLFIDVYEAAA